MLGLPRSCWILTLCLPLPWSLVVSSRAAEKLVLDHASIVVDAAEPSFVQYGVEELAGYLQDATGNKISVAADAKSDQKIRIVVGAKTAGQLLSFEPSADQLGDQGYVIRAVPRDGVQNLLVTGAAPQGTKAGLMAVMKAIQVDKQSAWIDGSIDRSHKPAIALRGMHFNGWAFNSPYSFRVWRKQDWKNYLDILAYQNVNLFYLWPFMEIMPVPLSPADTEYLEECRRVVDYAHEKHGMEVWIMQCTNRVAKDDCGVLDPRRRPYWRPTQEDLNPGDPEQFKAIMASRKALYKILNNVDAVCNIDSDPGYYPGSPASDYIKVLQGCRELLDRHNVHGKQTKLIDWMWEGWGLVPGQMASKGRDQLELDTMATLKTSLAEPWGLVAARGVDLTLCRKANTLERAVFLPYGAIEGEPAYPGTNLSIDAIRKLFATYVDKNPELRGVMGNLQTPILQFPNMYFYSSAMNDAASRQHSQPEVLLELSGYLYPEHAQLITNCYLALKEADPVKIEPLASQLAQLIKEKTLGRSGLFARKLFPNPEIVAESLVLQLNLLAAHERLVIGAPSVTDPSGAQKLLYDYFEAYFTWDTAHGWHNLWGWNTWPLGATKALVNQGITAERSHFVTTFRSLSKCLGDQPKVDACLENLSRQLSAKFDKTAVETGCVALLRKELLAAIPVESFALTATASASAVPDGNRYPPESAVDGYHSTRYWPGALVHDNTEWLQLSWQKPQSINKVIVRFLQHPSMQGRTIHLQHERAGKWEDFATAVIPTDTTAPHAVATFEFKVPLTQDKIRIVNLLDLFEVEVY